MYLAYLLVALSMVGLVATSCNTKDYSQYKKIGCFGSLSGMTVLNLKRRKREIADSDPLDMFEENDPLDMFEENEVNDAHNHHGAKPAPVATVVETIETLLCKCAEKANSQGYKYFAIQSFTTCTVGNDYIATSLKKGSCFTDLTGTAECSDHNGDRCVGGKKSNYIYALDLPCYLRTGDGKGDRMTWSQEGYKSSPDVCIQLCLTKRTSDPSINGVSVYPKSTQYYCYCLKGVTGRTNDGRYRSCVYEPSTAVTDICVLTKNAGCDHICKDVGTYAQCSCKPGHTLAANKHSCVVTDPCITKQCQQKCVIIGGVVATCTCHDGYERAGDGKSCIVINKCATNNGGCSHTCKNWYGSYKCECPKGYALASDKRTCKDINECLVNNGDCTEICLNKMGSYGCGCQNGGIDPNGKTCLQAAAAMAAERRKSGN